MLQMLFLAVFRHSSTPLKVSQKLYNKSTYSPHVNKYDVTKHTKQHIRDINICIYIRKMLIQLTSVGLTLARKNSLFYVLMLKHVANL